MIFSDGDAVFQPHKIMASGIWKAARGHVLVFVHKEKMLKEVERRYPAHRYIIVDDKLEILQALKKIWKNRVITVLMRGSKGSRAGSDARADITVRRIRDLPRVLRGSLWSRNR